MKTVIDTHVHTVACNHAYSTINENAAAAKEKGLELICITEHGIELPGGPHLYYFANIKVVPPQIDGVKILKGIEANIMDFDGNLDIPEKYRDRMEIILAGLHSMCLAPGSKKENTRALIKTMEKEYVDVIVHIGNPIYEVDYQEALKAAKDTNTIIEINNSSFVHSRKGSYSNCRMVAEECMKRDMMITLGSDAHIAYDVGEFGVAKTMLEEIDFPEDLIINTHVDKLVRYLESKGKKLFLDPRINIRDHR